MNAQTSPTHPPRLDAQRRKKPVKARKLTWEHCPFYFFFFGFKNIVLKIIPKEANNYVAELL